MSLISFHVKIKWNCIRSKSMMILYTVRVLDLKSDKFTTGSVLKLVSISPRNGYHLKWRYECGFIFSIVNFVISLIGNGKFSLFFFFRKLHTNATSIWWIANHKRDISFYCGFVWRCFVIITINTIITPFLHCLEWFVLKTSSNAVISKKCFLLLSLSPMSYLFCECYNYDRD